MINLSDFVNMTWLTRGILYLGPETIMPLASILAAVAGFILIFWRYIISFIKKIFGRGKSATGAGEELVDPDAPEAMLSDTPGDIKDEL